MNKLFLITLFSCAFFCTATLCEVHAQDNNAPNAGRPNRRGFGRGQGTPPGPPGPVPPEVVMPRPTADEIARMNAALKKFVETSPDKDLRLHPIEEGYEIGASSVAPTLNAWIKGIVAPLAPT